MFEGLVSTDHISFLFVFFEGLISFFSPCVLPLIPIYISYLAGNAKRTDENGVITYERKRVFFHTLFFVLGISFSFFILGLSFSALGSFFNNYKTLFSRIGGILIVLLGLFQIGFLDMKMLDREHRLPFKLKLQNMNPLVAFLMGFTFSFAWTPCVGPALSSVLILASGAKSALMGNLLVLVYALGFVLPFLALGLFTTQTLNFIKKRQRMLKYTIKAGGVLLILIGIMTFTGWMNGITSYLNSFSGGNYTANSSQSESTSSASEDNSSSEASSQQDKKTIPAFDFTLTDQYGNTHTLSDYKGKVVFLNFWATWCPPCRQEMPHIEELYNEYGKNSEDVIFIGVTNPKTDDHPNNTDVSIDEIKTFLTENGYTFPSVFDETGSVLTDYYVNAFPTTYMIDRDGNIFGYVSSALTKDMMKNIIEQTLEG
ncbi:cytochrome c-type biogenesis protein [Hydrogenoanaerobacterium saccharovorans]|uniref:Cytochrome c-type biogenesis protein n=1 Tax=Hydrogenoanaerobacterium saccharovorans TaxID=474960 RepID=A0A1H8A581_9FIRM|nr:cytochrome c biogenesis protein CcdA [Hydrogenoanaerobacterium saccharovorans]RPF48152.1 cytochrome c-type biogenesis protein [Hydrogenoanaerobacterium saccharovorans]SEM65850.1 cytochrome c-type biogenesis protein [Hydrogenoanaerobacterium saccharovorans]